MYPIIINDANLNLITLSDSLNHISDITRTSSFRNTSQGMHDENYKIEAVSMDFIYNEQ
jgi:hypothetical protein